MRDETRDDTAVFGEWSQKEHIVESGVDTIEKPALPPIYYDSHRRDFWIQNNRKGWISLSNTDIKRELRGLGFRAKIEGGELISPVEEALSRIQKEQDIAYAGPLAGYSSGMYEILGNRVLVTTSPTLIEPEKGDWPTIRAVIDGLLQDPHHNQQLYLYGWLQTAINSLRQGKRQPGQCLALAGPAQCGKSLLQVMITHLLGGRVARPYRYMSGGTDFNGELFGAEHLMLEDEQASTHIQARRNFGARIKEFTVNSSQSCHAKNKQAMSLTPFWRATISVNDETENLMVLPPLDESLKDKFILLKARMAKMPMPTSTPEEQAAFFQKLSSEFPAFIHDVLEMEIPKPLMSNRFGITHFHHPDVVSAIRNLAPEMRLLEIIDAHFFESPVSQEWEGTAMQLEKELTTSGAWIFEARKIFSFSTACGVYLDRLEKEFPHRVSSRRPSTGRIWTIHPPSGDN